MKFSRIVVMVMVLALVSAVMPAGVFGADPVYNAHRKADNTQDFVVDAPLAPGQVQAGKLVDFALAPTVFEIIFFAEGAPFEGWTGEGMGPVSPLNPDSFVIITDTLGPQFKPQLDHFPAELHYDAMSNTVTWEVPAADVTEDTLWVSFFVELQDGWTPGVWYPTNATAEARFVPWTGNPFYFNNPQFFTDAFTISLWQISSTRDFLDVTIHDDTHGTFHLQFHNTPAAPPVTIGGKTFTLFAPDSNPVGSGTDGQYGYARFGVTDIFEVWLNGLDGPGTTTVFTCIYDALASTITPGDKVIVFHNIYKADFTWEEGTVVTELTNNGWIMLEEVKKIPPTADPLSVANVVSLVGLLGLGILLTRKFK